MQVIRDWKEIRNIVDQNFEYSFIGFTRSNLFNYTHQYFYEHTVKTLNENRKLFGSLWDNNYDRAVFNNEEDAEPSFCRSDADIIRWFSERKFDYIFLPSSSFIHELKAHPQYSELIEEIDSIMLSEGYINLMPNFFKEDQIIFVKMVLARHYFLFTNRFFPKVLNKTCQLFAPDGTYGFIYRHFMEKYCGGEYSMLPLIRKPDGLVFDAMVERLYQQDIKDMFSSLSPYFEKFRTDRDVDKLRENIINEIHKPKQMIFSFVEIEHFCNEITNNKYIFLLQIKRNFMQDNGKYPIYRIWEYDNEV